MFSRVEEKSALRTYSDVMWHSFQQDKKTLIEVCPIFVSLFSFALPCLPLCHHILSDGQLRCRIVSPPCLVMHLPLSSSLGQPYLAFVLSALCFHLILPCPCRRLFSWLAASYFPLGSPSVALSGCHELIKRCASAAPLSSSRREFVGCLVFSSDGIVLVAALDSHHRSLFDLLVCCLCPCGFSCCQSATLKQAPRLENGFTLF